MKRYAVEVSDPASAAIQVQVRYIAIEKQDPANAQRWLGV